MTNSILNQNLLQHILQYSNEACVVVSAPDLILKEINRKACDILGRNRDDAIGMSLQNIECALQDIFFWDELNGNLSMSGQRIIASEWINSSGSIIPIEKRVTGYTDTSGAHYWIIYVEDISNRQRIAQEQLLLISQLQSSLEATAEGIFSVTLDGNVTNLNQRFISLWQLPNDIIAARKENIMMEYLLDCLVAPSSFLSDMSKLKSDPEIETETLLSLKDGRYFICISKPEFLRDRLIGRVFSMRDITAMKKTEEDLLHALSTSKIAEQEKSRMLDALKAGEARLLRIMNSSLIGICQGNAEGLLILANNALKDLLGFNNNDIENSLVSWLNLASSESIKDHQLAFDELKNTGHTQPYNVELIDKLGNKISAMIGLAQLEGDNFEWVAFILDLTEQKKADRLKSEFISVVSHELRTPITSIRGAMSILEAGASGELPPKAMQLVQIAHRNSQRLGTLVNDILDMEKLISGKMEFKYDIFNLCKTAKDAIEVNTAYAAALEVNYKLYLKTDSEHAIGDPDRTLQVLANLLSNAAKFSPKGESVDVSVVDADNFLRVEVKDKGAGIPLAFRELIFTKFAQADSSTKRQQGGTGLGLSIAKSMVEKMGGAIGFESEIGQGSLFWFTLPKPN